MHTRIKLKESEIVDEYTVCPYCMNQVSRDRMIGCCGESSCHFEKAYLTKDDELLLESEIEFIKE